MQFCYFRSYSTVALDCKFSDPHPKGQGDGHRLFMLKGVADTKEQGNILFARNLTKVGHVSGFSTQFNLSSIVHGTGRCVKLLHCLLLLSVCISPFIEQNVLVCNRSMVVLIFPLPLEMHNVESAFWACFSLLDTPLSQNSAAGRISCKKVHAGAKKAKQHQHRPSPLSLFVLSLHTDFA